VSARSWLGIVIELARLCEEQHAHDARCNRGCDPAATRARDSSRGDASRRPRRRSAQRAHADRDSRLALCFARFIDLNQMASRVTRCPRGDCATTRRGRSPRSTGPTRRGRVGVPRAFLDRAHGERSRALAPVYARTSGNHGIPQYADRVREVSVTREWARERPGLRQHCVRSRSQV
jgi:hypothetical protein